MRCPQCRHENKAQADLCRHCGARLAPVQSAELESEISLPDDAPAWQSEVLKLYRKGRAIEAIKVCRAATGLGLKEAKESVERLAAEQGLGDLVLRQQRTQSVGCMLLSAIGVVLLLSLLWLATRGG